MITLKKNALYFIFILLTNIAWSQVSISGYVYNNQKTAIEGAHVLIQPTNQTSLTNYDGTFNVQNISAGNYTLKISYLGYKTISKVIEVKNNDITLEFNLEPDLLNLQTIVVTGSFNPNKTIETSTSVSTLTQKDIQNTFPRGTANLLQNIAGTFTDASAGEVFTRVYTRGVSASAEDDMGWYYVSLQEDGLPVSLVQHSYYSPDLFHRTDITTQKVEALRGGNASVTAMNAPGGIYNFISKGVNETFGGEIIASTGIQGEDNNPIYRVDANLSGPLGNNWYFNLGGHYRHDDGARNTNFTFSKGGQAKLNLIKTNKNGYFKFYGKLLDDYTNRYTGVAATNWNDPKPAFGQSFSSTALMIPSFDVEIPDGRNPDKTNSFNPSKGVHTQDFALGFDFSQNISNNWTVKNNIKFSTKKANWQTSISNAFVSLNDPTAYFVSGADYPIGQVVFNDAQSGTELARVDNSTILSGGLFQYLTNGSLPNDAIMGTSAWYKDISADELMNNFVLQKQLKNHTISTGLSLGFSKTDHFTQGSFAYVTYEPNPKMLQVTLQNPNQPIVALSDATGASNYGGLFYINTNANVNQIATFINDEWNINQNLRVDIGLRLENITHKGSKDQHAPLGLDGGVDGNENTAYDNSLKGPTGETDDFNFNYNYISYSAGLNYSLSTNAAIFGRFSRGNKAPELNYYFNNFDNVPINGKGEVQKITQIETGIKLSSKSVSFTSTLFWSELKNIGSSNFEFDSNTNTVFYTPIQFNTSRTLGFEWESIVTPIENIAFKFNGVLQNPKAEKWRIYNAAGTVDTNDDTVTDYSGNQLAFNPKLMFNLGSYYNNNTLSAFFNWQYMGKREGNAANAFQLDAYSTFNTGIGYKITKNLSANLVINNLFNSEGLANFFGANSFGASANGVTKDFVQANPDASFVVVPILPRSSLINLNYIF